MRSALLPLLFLAFVLAFVLAAPLRAAPLRAAPRADEDWYPADVTPPAGTHYPCALTALPRDLPGIPESDRRFINHSYSLVLKATQAKLVLLNVLATNGPYDDALDKYLAATGDARHRLSAEPTPSGLAGFAADVLGAIDDQQAFFKAAASQRGRGTSMADVYRIPEGHRASTRLLSAWSQMQKRYPSWSDAVRESVYHHLCALDLF